MSFYYFNFSSDLALAQDKPCYTPPINVRAMEQDLQCLAFYVSADNFVVVDRGMIQVCQEFFDRDCFVSVEEAEGKLIPWGWNRTLLFLYKNANVEKTYSESQLNELRRLASRKIGVEMLAEIQRVFDKDCLCGDASFCTSMDDVNKVLSKGKEGLHIFKAPLSGSGRGLRFDSAGITQQLIGWCKNCIDIQGGVVVETLFDKVLDFAAEFDVTEDDVIFKGWSVFATTKSNAYLGNYIESQEKLLHRITTFIPEGQLKEIINEQTLLLRKRFCGVYQGPLGVDMMVCKSKEATNGDVSYRLHPLVEINMRYTMGYLSLFLNQYVANDKTAMFKIVYAKENEELQKQFKGVESVFSVGKLENGFALLSPLTQECHYVAVLEVC